MVVSIGTGMESQAFFDINSQFHCWSLYGTPGTGSPHLRMPASADIVDAASLESQERFKLISKIRQVFLR